MSVREINLQTGEETVRPYTSEELAAIAASPPPPPPPPPAPADPVDKLKAFLTANPDVAALLTK